GVHGWPSRGRRYGPPLRGSCNRTAHSNASSPAMPLRRARRDASRLARLSNPAFPFLGFESNLVRDPKQNAPQGGVLFWIWRRGRDYSRLAPLALRARAARGSAHRFAVLVLAACAARARRLNDAAPGEGGHVISHQAEED